MHKQSIVVTNLLSMPSSFINGLSVTNLNPENFSWHFNWMLQSIIKVTGKFSQNVGQVFSKLKLVTGYLLQQTLHLGLLPLSQHVQGPVVQTQAVYYLL